VDRDEGILRGSAALIAPGILVRPVGADERAGWELLWNGYLNFYEATLKPGTTDVTWARLQDPGEPMFVLGAYAGSRLIGIAHYIYHRSCWTSGDYCYLQDLFVVPDQRGNGTGQRLIAAVEDAARTAGASRVHWLTKEENAVARALYDRVGERSGFIQYRKVF
jgi:GNAT superfamily N-acetyltransferase